jgi:integrase
MQPIEWMIEDAARQAGLAVPVGGELYMALGNALIARLCEACVPTIEPVRARIIPPEILIVSAGASPTVAHAATSGAPILRSIGSFTTSPSAGRGPKLRAVFDDWCQHKARDPKLVDEWSTAIRRFDALHDAPPVDAITAEMVREFRKVYSRLPSRVPDAIAELPLREQNLIAERDELPTLAPATVNKALSGLRVMLEHAVEEMQVIPGNVAKTVRGLQTDGEIDSRLPFTPEDMQLIFSRDLPRNKSGVSPETMAWMLLLGPYTGCRLEELGKLRPSNVRTERGIAFIAIERDRKVARDKERKEGKTGSKRSKTQAAYREIPLHPLLIEAGLLELVRRRRDEGAEWLFDDLTTDKYGSRTKRLSRVINDWFDAIGLSDPELVYHSFRHTVRRVLRGRADRDLVDLIAGHSDGSVGSKYGRGAALEPLRDAIGLIDYPEVDWLPVVTRARDSVRARLSSKQPA